MKLRIKFSLFSIGLVIVVLLGMSIILFIFEKRHLLQTMRENQEDAIKAFAEVCKKYIEWKEDELILINYLNPLKNTEGVAYAMFVNRFGKIVVHTDTVFYGKEVKDNIGINAITAKRILFQNYKDKNNVSYLEVSAPVYVRHKKEGTARIGFYQAELDRIVENTLSKTRHRIFIVGIIGLLLGVIGAFGFAQLMNKPIQLLVEGAKSIGQGNLKHRIPIETKDELGDLASEFNVMALKLQELDQMKDDFVSSVSHELRSPLTSIKGYVDFILMGKSGPINEKQLQYLTIVKNNTARLANFINDILDLAKIEAQRIELIKEPINIASLMREMAIFFRPQSEETKVKIEVSCEEDLPRVYVDTDKIRQVFTNLISNAFKFTSEGGIITLFAKRTDDSFIECWVKDTGIGISPEDAKKIFDKFTQIKKSQSSVRKVKGTGLGLTIVKGIIETHGGRIWVESQIGKGSTFKFTLPVYKE